MGWKCNSKNNRTKPPYLEERFMDLGGLSFEDAVGKVAKELTEIKQSKEKVADAKSWEMAETYVAAYKKLDELYYGQFGKYPKTHWVNRQIRSQPDYEGPGSSWLSHATKVGEVFHDVLLPATKLLPYEFYRHIANSDLNSEDKDELRKWAEEINPTRQELRMEIRKRVDKQNGIYKPDFDLKYGNCWKFSDQNIPSEFDGGIHPELVANLLYYFTDQEDKILDPMAGGDTTFKVVNKYKFFKEEDEKIDFSGKREVFRSDISPENSGIIKADIRETLPFSENHFDFCILDPPYYQIPKGEKFKYVTFGDSIEEWISNMVKAIENIKTVLKPGGSIAIIVDDYLRSGNFEPLAGYVFNICLKDEGLESIATIYNTYPHFVVSMGPLEMWRYKKARLLLNAVKIINVFEKRR
jgi:DNA modification methylase